MNRNAFLFLAATTMSSTACSDDAGNRADAESPRETPSAGGDDGGGSGSGGGGGTGGGSPQGSGGTLTGTGGLGFGSTIPVDPVPTGEEQTCNGIDDDGNGVVDDVDLEGDGICDCLRIATAGAKGDRADSVVFNTWLEARSPLGAVDLSNAPLTAETLAGYQVLVLQDISARAPLTEDEVTAVHEWVSAGGGLLTLIGYAAPTEVENVNRILEPMGLAYEATPILASGAWYGTLPVTGWSSHPVTEGVQRIGVDNGYPVAGDGAGLAREGGYEVLRVREEGEGRVVVWGDEWITYDSEWADHPDYQVERFWLNILKWLSPANECQVELPPIE